MRESWLFRFLGASIGTPSAKEFFSNRYKATRDWRYGHELPGEGQRPAARQGESFPSQHPRRALRSRSRSGSPSAHPVRHHPLHLPLSLSDSAWISRPVPAGDRRYGFFNSHGQTYETFVWIGRAAPSHDRAVLTQALASVQPAR